MIIIPDGKYNSSYLETIDNIQSIRSVPASIKRIMMERAEAMNIREHFYICLCLYQQFMTDEGYFT
ncbi:hypothetical protein [Peribacillus butanolivorans]|uniref:hypothetical protein n=1 Tax=Peribacillus butanolivorans TaxID=421767 RepID=UPI0036706979